jgi:hypothetical protein
MYVGCLVTYMIQAFPMTRNLDGPEVLLEIFTRNISSNMDELLAQFTPNNDIESDANIRKLKEHIDDVLAQFPDQWRQVKDILARDDPEVGNGISIDYERKYETERREKELEHKREKLERLQRRVNELRTQVPQQLVNDN